MSESDTALRDAAAAPQTPESQSRPRSQSPPRVTTPTGARSRLTPFLRDWHRRAGLFAFLFMGWLGLSGILINQSPSWGYDTDRIYWSWVMWLYSLEPAPPTTGYTARGVWLAQTPEGTVLDGRPLVPPIKLPLGMVSATVDDQLLYFIADPKVVAVVTREGVRFDELRAPILPVDAVRRIGTVPETGAVAVQDLDAFQSADGGTSWTPVDPLVVKWSEAIEIPAAERERLLEFSRPFVTLEHILVDAHSGALFGRGGVYVINAVGVAALWLAISGVWMWWRTQRRRKS